MKAKRLSAVIAVLSVVCMLTALTTGLFVKAADAADTNILLKDNNRTGTQIIAEGLAFKDLDTFANISRGKGYGPMGLDSTTGLPKKGNIVYLTDGDNTTEAELYGGLADTDKSLRGVLFDLKSYYDISKLSMYFSTGAEAVKDFVAFAAEELGPGGTVDFTDAAHKIGDVRNSTEAHRESAISPVKTRVRYVAIFFGGYTDYPRIKEIEVFGKLSSGSQPTLPPPVKPNLLVTEAANITDLPRYDDGSWSADFTIPKYPDPKNENKEAEGFASTIVNGYTLDKYRDGDQVSMNQIYGGMPDDKTRRGRPIIVFDMGGYYDIDLAMAIVHSDIKRVRIYASAHLEKIAWASNLIYCDDEDSNQDLRIAELNTPKKVRYVAFALARTTGDWKASEFVLYGQKSADQTTAPAEAAEATYKSIIDPPVTESDNILFEKTPIEAGLVKDDLYYEQSGVGGSANWETQLSDGVITNSEGFYQNAQLWAGDKDVAKAGGKYTVTYDMEGYYNLTEVAVQPVPTMPSQQLTGWFAYAGNDLFTLFDKENKITELIPVTDEQTYTKVPVDVKSVRYVAYVFTQIDTEYGAARISEIEAFGTKDKDLEKPPEKGSGYIEYEDKASGATIWIFTLEDELEVDMQALIGSAKLSAINDNTLSDKIVKGLLNYFETEQMFEVKVFDPSGNETDLGGRKIAVFLNVPAKLQGKNLWMAQVDGDSVEVLNATLQDNVFSFDSSFPLQFAVVSSEYDDINKMGGGGSNDPIDPDPNPPTGSVSDIFLMLSLLLAAVSGTLMVVSKVRTHRA